MKLITIAFLAVATAFPRMAKSHLSVTDAEKIADALRAGQVAFTPHDLHRPRRPLVPLLLLGRPGSVLGAELTASGRPASNDPKSPEAVQTVLYGSAYGAAAAAGAHVARGGAEARLNEMSGYVVRLASCLVSVRTPAS